jgi:hypothetical protein
MRTLKTNDKFEHWFNKFNELIATGVVGSFSNDPDFNSGLDFFVRSSSVRRGTGFTVIPDTFVTLADNETSLVYLDATVGFEEIASAPESSFPIIDAVALYRVVTSAGQIVSVEDHRSWLNIEAIDHQGLLNLNDPDAHPQYVLKIQNNLSATSDPDVTNDVTEGYDVLSIWINQSTNEMFKCLNNAEGAAVWGQTTLELEDLGFLAVGDDASDVPITDAGNSYESTDVEGALQEVPDIAITYAIALG